MASHPFRIVNVFTEDHGPFTGNPLCCAAAVETLKIFADEKVLESNRVLSQQMEALTRDLEDHPHVAEVRQRGMILAIEMVKDKASREPYAWQERRGMRVYRHALERGLLLRPIGSVIYFMPPYVITPEEIELMVTVAREGVELATCD